MASKEEMQRRFLAKFRAAALERVAQVSEGFSRLEQQGDDPATADLVMRELHTLKGEAHIMGLLDINDLAHVTEDILTWARGRKFQLEASVVDLVYLGLDLIQAHVDEDRDDEALAAQRESFLESGRKLLARVVAPLDPDDAGAGDGNGEGAPPPAPATGENNGAGTAAPLGRGLGDFIRVPSATISRVTSLTSELILRQESLVRELNGLWFTLRWQSVERPAGRATLERLRWLRDQVFESSLLLEDLQSTVHEVRLLHLSALFDRYPAAIRSLARESGKRVRVVVRGGDVRGDKQVLDVIDQAILHLVRNSLDHGIEPPAERRSAGKSEQGTITLAARQQGTRIYITVRDNGRGLDPAGLRATAVARGIIDAREAEALGDDDSMQLIFRPGFTTRDQASTLSGRGVGLDVVNEQVNQLGGVVQLATTAGRGTSFTLDLPTTVAMSRIFNFRCGDVIFGLASTSVERVFRASATELEPAGAGLAVEHEGDRIPIADMRAELDEIGSELRQVVEIVVVEHAGQKIGLAVDQLLGERQVVQRSLGEFLAGLRLISGAVVLDTGEVSLLLSVVEIARRWGEGDSRLIHALPTHATGETPWRVLIVDDSELTRDMLVGVAQRGNFTVDEAVNGREGLARMHANRPDLVLTDLDMPVMNGFDFIERVRAEPAFEEVPIVVLTTRGSDEDKRRAMIAGANAYIVKTGFSQQTLRETLDRLLDPRPA